MNQVYLNRVNDMLMYINFEEYDNRYKVVVKRISDYGDDFVYIYKTYKTQKAAMSAGMKMMPAN